MDIERIRQWVRGQLPPTERREVGRWMLRSTDPALPGILQGLVREHEEEIADAALRRRMPERGFVIDLWSKLLELGHATVEALRPPGLAGGPVLGAARVSTGLSFRERSGEVVVDLVLSEARAVALFATTDLGDEQVLLEPTVMEPGTYVDLTAWVPEAHEGRVTFWLVLGAEEGAPVGAMGTLAGAVEQLGVGEVEVVGGRWVEPG